LSALSTIPSDTREKIRIHDDRAAHEAAAALNARAFTIGSSIYFGKGEYQPTTTRGLRTLAHEAAHAHQQANAALPPTEQLEVSSTSSHDEISADRFANFFARGEGTSLPVQTSHGSVARLMRLTFEVADPGEPKGVDIKERVQPMGGGPGGQQTFGFGGGGNEERTVQQGIVFEPELYLFNWAASARVHGSPGEEFNKWRAGMLQTMRKYSFHISWGNGAYRCGGDRANFQDGWETGNPWFNPAKTSAPFTGDGDVKGSKIVDSPYAYLVPYQNPKGSQKNGEFDFRNTFDTYFSVGYMPEDIPLNFVHLLKTRWELRLKVAFDGTDPLSPKFEIISGGTTANPPVPVPPGEQPVIGGKLAQDEIAVFSPCWEIGGTKNVEQKEEEKQPQSPLQS
jgi:hypothetical protein